MKNPVFVSYAREDSDFALRLAADLKAKGANVWLDQLDIRPGRQWDREVERALTTCDEMLVILSPAAIDSNNVMDEVAFALEERKTVIPVLRAECRLPFRLRRLQYIDVTSDYKRGLEALVSALAQEEQISATAVAGAAETPAVVRTSSVSDQQDDAGQDRIAGEKAETERHAEQERILRERVEAAHKAEQERIAREKVDAARLAEQERIARTNAEAARQTERERISREKAEAARLAEQERIARASAEAARQAEQERISREKAEATQRAEQERIAREKAEAAPYAEQERIARREPDAAEQGGPQEEDEAARRWADEERQNVTRISITILIIIGVIVLIFSLTR